MNGLSTILIVVGLFLVGGIYSFVKQEMPKNLIVLLSIAAAMCLVAGVMRLEVWSSSAGSKKVVVFDYGFGQGVLRTGEHQEGGEYVPQPDVEQIDDLVEQCRTSGLPVDFKVEGTPRPLPSGVELTAYRIVQEALTNTRKHGGPNTGASVRLVYFDDGLGLLVEDDGKGAPHELYEEGGADGAGHGLIGMRERVGMVGGTLDAGPRPGGGFRISALLPLKPAH